MSAVNMRLSRRNFLLVTLASLASACSSTDNYVSGGTAGSASAWLPLIVGDYEAATRLGRAWLAAHPEYNSSDMLVTDIQQALTQYDAFLDYTPQQIVTALQQLVRHEYIHGDAEAVNGWILSVTEVRLYALAALGESQASLSPFTRITVHSSENPA